MIFDDLFYPGNPGRRKEVENIRARIQLEFRDYKTAWNELARILNEEFAKSKDPELAKKRLKVLKKNIETDTVGDCVTEINEVLKDTKDIFNKLDDRHALWRLEDGSYVIVEMPTVRKASADESELLAAEKEICRKLVAQGAYEVLIPAA